MVVLLQQLPIYQAAVSERAHFYTRLLGVSCVLDCFIQPQQEKTADLEWLRHALTSRWLHPLA